MRQSALASGARTSGARPASATADLRKVARTTKNRNFLDSLLMDAP